MPKPKQSPSEPPKILFKGDTATVVLTADKAGKIRVNCASFETPAVVLEGQCLEVRWQAGQVVLIKRDQGKK